MKLSPLAERLIAKADAKRRPSDVATEGAACNAASVVISASLATLPALLKISETAAYLGISEDAVWNFRDLGVLTFIDIRVPGASRASWRIQRASLAEFEAQRTIKT